MGWTEGELKKRGAVSPEIQDLHPKSHLWSGLGNKSTSVEAGEILWFWLNVNSVVSCDSSHCGVFPALNQTIIFPCSHKEVTTKRVTLTKHPAHSYFFYISHH